jgi:endonuclease/exonuclease/phosphatase family metal-dependent hydrolase
LIASEDNYKVRRVPLNRWFCRFAWGLGCVLLSLRVLSAPLTVATYNLEFYVDQPTLGTPPKTVEARALVRESIRRVNPDVIALEEVGSISAFRELVASLKAEKIDFQFTEYIQAADTNLHLAIMSRLPIIARRPHTNENFLFEGKRRHVLRGFAEIDVIAGRNERVTLIGAHLKSKRQSIEADQQGLREEEATLLRERIDDFFRQNPNGNLIVLGDFNDDVSSRTVRTILGKGRTKLFDPRPAERNGDSMTNANSRYEPRRIFWTHYFGKEESYHRIDYIFVSQNLKAAVDEKESYVFAIPNWGVASDHRPVSVRLNVRD